MPSWECKITAFEGPLDLLLHLVKRAKIDLEDIFVSEITDQYLEYMNNMKNLDMDKASEFINMASLLIYIKSHALVPFRKEERDDGIDDYIDPEKALIERLRIYQLYKDSTEIFKELAEQAGDYFYKLPEDIVEEDDAYIILNVNAKDIENAFKQLMKRISFQTAKPTVQISQDLFSIRKQKNKIENMVNKYKTIKFSDLFGKTPSPMEIAVTLFALLELWHKGNVNIDQIKPFSQIKIYAS